METQITNLTETTGLAKIVDDSGLQLNEGEEIKQSYLPFFNQLAEIKDLSKKINFENPTALDEKIARELRLKTVKIRTSSQDIKDNRKKIHQLKADVEQSSWNLIKSTCQLEEERFLQVEKSREIQEQKRKLLLKQERLNKLIPFGFQDNNGFNLGEMDDNMFDSLYNGLQKAYEERIESEKRAEVNRIFKEQEEKRDQYRRNKMFELGLKWNGEEFIYKDINFHWDDLIYMDDVEFENAVDGAAKRKLFIESEERAEQEKIRIENERLKKEAEEKEAEQKEITKLQEERLKELLPYNKSGSDVDMSTLWIYTPDKYSQILNEKKKDFEKQEAERKATEQKLREEKEKAELKQKHMAEEAAKLKATTDAKLKKEQQEKAKLQAQLKAKEEAEAKLKQELEEKEKARIAEERRLAKQPVKIKLNNWIDNFSMGSPIGMDEDETVKTIQKKFEEFKGWAKRQIENI